MIFQGIRTSIAKKPCIFVIFQGEGSGPPVPPLDPLMNFAGCFFKFFFKNKKQTRSECQTVWIQVISMIGSGICPNSLKMLSSDDSQQTKSFFYCLIKSRFPIPEKTEHFEHSWFSEGYSRR